MEETMIDPIERAYERQVTDSLSEPDCHCFTFGKAGATTKIHYCSVHSHAHEMLEILKEAEAAWGEYEADNSVGVDRLWVAFANVSTVIAKAGR
jgi:hypothetical protein